MAKIYYSTLTDLGRELATQAITTAAKIGIEQFAVGDGGGAYYAPTGTETELRREKYRGNVQRLEATGSRIVIDALIPTTSTGYTVREIGIFTASGEMVAIGNLPDIPKDAVTDGAIGELLISMELQVTNADVFDLVVDPNTLLVTKPQLDAAIEQARSHTYAAALPADGWAQQSDGSYTQTAACEGMTAQVVIWDVRAQPGATTADNLAIAEALGCITMAESLEGQVAVTCGDSCPNVELTAVFLEV